MDNTPDSPAKTPEGYTTQGGNFWTLITPEIWKVLHAVLQILGLVIVVFMVWPAAQWVWSLPYGPGILVFAVLLWGVALK